METVDTTLNKDLDENGKIVSDSGLANKRTKISFSNFPLKLDSKYFDKSYITNNINSFSPSGVSLQYTEDTAPGGLKILVPSDVYEYTFEDNALSLSINLDPYRRNYFMFFDLAMSHIRKNKSFKGEDGVSLESLDELMIEHIHVDICDNVGNAKTLMSLVYSNCLLNNLSGLDFDIQNTDQTFEVGLIYESVAIDYDRMELLSKLEK